MFFHDSAIAGVVVLEPERRSDERGFFARTFCEEELGSRGLVRRFQQSSLSFNARRGTVRGMHFSLAPHEETKIVRCTSGAVHDVLIDLRRGSSTYRKCVGFALTAENRHALYVPPGVAHGFQALADGAELLYMIDLPYDAGAASGVRWNDPAFHVAWPEPISVISARDLDFDDWAI